MLSLVMIGAAALLSTCDSSTLHRQLRIQRDSVTNSIQTKEIPPRPNPDFVLKLRKQPHPINLLTPGTTLELTCEVFGSPAPTVHWYRNDEPVYEHDLESNEVLHQGPPPTSLGSVVSTLLVTKGNRDTYTCFMTSGTQTARASTAVYTIDGSTDFSERSRLLPLKPKIVAYYNDYMDNMGNSATLLCRAKGHPRPHITWQYNNGTLIKNNSRIKILRSGELMIQSLSWEDMGGYICTATNVFGTDFISTFLYPIEKDS